MAQKEPFPQSAATAEGMQVLPGVADGLSCRVRINVPYAIKSGRALHLNIIEPVDAAAPDAAYPLVVFIQGSAWFEQNTACNLGHLSDFARRGYVIATVQYRPSTLAPFPAQAKDAKDAVRFMVQNAAEYHVNPASVTLWGDSSGGHTALMAGITMSDADYPAHDDAPGAQPTVKISAIIDYYGPSDIIMMDAEPSSLDHTSPHSPEGLLLGGKDVKTSHDLARAASPVEYIRAEKEIPPVLIFHGSADSVVPFGQSVLLYNRLKDSGKQAAFYKIDGADHGGGAFWTKQVLDIIEDFMQYHASRAHPCAAAEHSTDT